jgi:hypothetical protein
MPRPTATTRPFALVACLSVAGFTIAAGCSSRGPTPENVSASSSAEVVGGCECVETGTCDDLTYSNKPSDGSYYIATFTGGTMACGGTADGSWAYVADESRFGCGTKLKVSHNGKSCVAQVADCGPNRCVEQAAAGSCDEHSPVLDASPLISNYLYGESSIGWIQRQSVTVTELDSRSQPGCPGTPVASGASGDGGSSSSSGGTCSGGSAAVTRAQEWVSAELHYCQAREGAVDIDPLCWAWEGPSHVCDRKSNAAWNPYRSDGSGFVDWAWGLPPVGDGGYVTSNYAPYDSSFSSVIPAEALQPGDAVNLNVEGADGQLLLFVKWITPGSEAEFMVEPGCSDSQPYAHAFDSAVTVSGSNIYVVSQGATWTAIRYNGGGTGCTGSTSTGCYDATLKKTVANNACVEDQGPGGPLMQCINGVWNNAVLDPNATCDGPIITPMTMPSPCQSETLNKQVTSGTCVQSSTNDDWYQCINGEWVDRWTSTTPCSVTVPLPPGPPKGNSCYTPDCHHLKVPDNACVELSDGVDWIECDNGSWTNRWTDVTPCNGLYVFPASDACGSGSGSGSQPGSGSGSGSGSEHGSGSGSGSEHGSGSGSHQGGSGSGTGHGHEDAGAPGGGMDATLPPSDTGAPSDDAGAPSGGDDAGGSSPPPSDDSGAPSGDEDAGGGLPPPPPPTVPDQIATIAAGQAIQSGQYQHACNPSSSPPVSYGTSCTGDNGHPEAWAGDFAKWVWGAAGIDVSSLTNSAQGFWDYGQTNGTLRQGYQSIPAVGDAIIFKGAQGSMYVAIIVGIPNDSTMTVVGGNWGNGSLGHGDSSDPAQSIVLQVQGFDGVWQEKPGWVEMNVVGYVAPVY